MVTTYDRRFPSSFKEFVDNTVHSELTTVIDYFGNEYTDVRLDLKSSLGNVPNTFMTDMDNNLPAIKIEAEDEEGVLDDKLRTWYGIKKEVLTGDYEKLKFELTDSATLAYSIIAGNGFINPPNIVSPINNEKIINLTFTAVGSPYETTMLSEAHDSTDWQISTTSDFSTVIEDIQKDSVNLTSRSFTLGSEGFYYVRCRYHSVNKMSEWSNAVIFELALEKIAQPSITYPLGGATGVPGTAIITSSAYTPINHTNPHESTDWQIATDSGFTNIVYESLGDTENLTNIDKTIVTYLDENTSYYVKCRYHSGSIISNWSAAINFTTKTLFEFREVGTVFARGVHKNLSRHNGWLIAVDLYKTDLSLITRGLTVKKWNPNTLSFDERFYSPYSSSGYTGILGSSPLISSDGEFIFLPIKKSYSSLPPFIRILRWNSVSSTYELFQELSMDTFNRDDGNFTSASISEDTLTLTCTCYGVDDDLSNVIESSTLWRVYTRATVNDTFNLIHEESYLNNTDPLTDPAEHNFVEVGVNSDGSKLVLVRFDKEFYDQTPTSYKIRYVFKVYVYSIAGNTLTLNHTESFNGFIYGTWFSEDLEMLSFDCSGANPDLYHIDLNTGVFTLMKSYGSTKAFIAPNGKYCFFDDDPDPTNIYSVFTIDETTKTALYFHGFDDFLYNAVSNIGDSTIILGQNSDNLDYPKVYYKK